MVKLRQMIPNVGEDHSIIVNTNTSIWQPIQPNILQLILFSNDKTGERVMMQKWQAGAEWNTRYPLGEEILVIDGDLEDNDGTYTKGVWIRNPASWNGKEPS